MYLNCDASTLVNQNVAAYILGVSYTTVADMVKRKELPHTRTAMGTLLFDIRDVMEHRKQRKGKRKRAHRGTIDQLMREAMARVGA